MVVLSLSVSLSLGQMPSAQRLPNPAISAQTTPESSEPSVWDSLWDTLNPAKIAERSAARLHGFLRDKLVDFLNDSFQGTIQIGRTEGSVLGSVTFHAVSLQYQGVEILNLPRLTVSYELTQLVQGRVQVSRLEGFEPRIRLSQDAQGNWNIAQAFRAPTEQAEEAGDDEGGLDIVLEKVRLHDAQLDISLPENNPPAETTHYQLTDTNLEAKIDILAAGLDVQVQQLAARLSAAHLPSLQADAVLTYRGSVSPPTVNVEQLNLESDQSHLQLAGTIHNLDTLDTDATLTLDKLAVADARQVLPDWPLKEDVSGSLQVNGPLTDMHGQLSLTAAAASVQATLQADLSQDEPRYDGTLRLAQFDVQKMLTLEEVAGIVEGTIKAQGVGTEVADLHATADLQVQALRVTGWQLGTGEVNGSLAKQQATLRGKLSGDLGRASWDGTLNLGQEQPAYTLALSVEDFDAKKVGQAGQDVSALKSDLSLAGTVQGRGFSLATMQTQADIKIQPSTVGPVEILSGRVLGQIADRRIQIKKASLTATDAHIDIQGELGTSLEQDGQLSYALQVKNVSSWLSLVDHKGSGAVSVTGEAHGNLDRLAVQGELTAQALHVAENTVQDGTVRFDLHNVGQSRPYGTLSAIVHGLNAGLALQTAEATVELPQRPATAPLIAQVDLQARDQTARSHHLASEISYHDSQLAARLSVVSLALANGTWQLSQPARLVYNMNGTSDSLSIEQLVVTNQDQQLRLDGQAGLSGKQSLDIQLNNFALDSLHPLLDNPPDVQGRLSLQAQLNGTAAAPRLEAQLDVADLSVAGQAYAGLSSALRYSDTQASIDVTLQQDHTHALLATGTIPVQVSWAQGWQMETAGDLDVRVHSSGLNLAVLNALSGEAVQDIAGELGIDVRLQGPLAHPLPRGSFQLDHGTARFNPLGVQVSALTVDGQVDPEQIRFSQIEARAEAGKETGQLSGNGVIALRGYQPEHINLSVAFDRWPAIHTQTYQVRLNGQVEASGPLASPRLHAQLSVPQAMIRPDLALLEDSPIQRDETIVIVRDAQASRVADEETGTDTQQELQNIAQTEAAQELSLDVQIALPRNTWVKHRNADIELAGQVHAVQTHGNALKLVGTIRVVRGWVGFQGRRFTLSRGQVVFTGGQQIDPSLDIVATYQTSDREYTVELIIGGTAQEPTLTLQSEPSLEQADILAVLMFGKPASALGQGEKVDLQQQALAITSGYAARQIGQSVSEALGLESLGVDLREVDLTGGRVGFGRYIGDKTYLSASQDLSGKRGREVSVDYQLSRSGV